MTAAELDALFDDSADPDLDFEFGSPGAGGEQQGDWDMADGGKAVDGFELVDELEVFEATQGDQDGDKTFRPLFED
ncbi:hypothetical protein JAAARDRAFT_54788 [Jaapia argillacea MUCL 33604]|uniref:Uncharacterized protein n=1 Tax=Jaapia argillacea MUCL 33604 TaxID=933084 RepID=A0A067Q2W2_9AGAM|nr:hypothetical protein JAAARDRAFT_54788 [Jaapia argillacea MUCL 33604]